MRSAENEREYVRLYRLAFPAIDREYARLYNLAFPEIIRARCHRWLAANRKKRNLSKRQYRLANIDKIKAYNKQWRIKNFVKRQVYDKHYRLTHNSKMRAKSQKRKALKLKATIGDLSQIQKIYERAAQYRKWFDVVVDHIIPLSKGGAHSPENLQIIYAEENSVKGARLDYRPRVIFV